MNTLLKPLQILPALLLLAQATLPAQALTPAEALQKLARPPATVSFTGRRSLKVTRANMAPLITNVQISYADKANFDLTLLTPKGIQGTRIQAKNNVVSLYFPSDKYFLYNFNSMLPASFVLSAFPVRADLTRLLSKNYEVLVRADEVISGRKTWQLEFVPRNATRDQDLQTPIALVPRRRVWLDQSSLQVLKDVRFWDFLHPDGRWDFSTFPYSENVYEQYQPGAKPALPTLQAGAGARKLQISGQKSRPLSYSSYAAAQTSEGLKIALAGYLPPGFVLQDLQVYSLGDAKVQIHNYTDGLNQITVAIQPLEDALKAMITGDFKQSLLNRLSELSLHVPYNFYSASLGKHTVAIFGDVTPVELARVANRLKL